MGQVGANARYARWLRQVGARSFPNEQIYLDRETLNWYASEPVL